jgi:hypothetical protein
MPLAPDCRRTPRPANRRLRVFAFDPILSGRIDTHQINEATIALPWDDGLAEGPVDDYLEVVDSDPASASFYAPVDLNGSYILAQNGLPPSEGNPQFHQQMVYAVARKTISHFERALGRRALWSARRTPDESQREHVRLRVYPHALREANAYYSPSKKALLFGYFPASRTEYGENLPGGTVFTCLSHDIVAHETSHALLDGLHELFIEPSNVDVWAFHEAFADIVALFQHFSYPEVLRHQIARTRGDLAQQSLLGELAHQFGQAVERYGALRSAIGKVDPVTRKWKLADPDPTLLEQQTSPHERGAILVAAVFDAFLAIYKRRIADLLRIATGGTGVLPGGDLHPDLVERMAQEASKTARHMLQICIRALDYCPPVDVCFGDYLRALITADFDLVTDDRLSYRLAIIEAFRRRGIFPRGVRSLSVESLLWHEPDEQGQEALLAFLGGAEGLPALVPDWGSGTDLQHAATQAEHSRQQLCEAIARLREENIDTARSAAQAAGLAIGDDAPGSIERDGEGHPRLEVTSVRPARRIGPEGHTICDLVIEMTQRRYGYYDPDEQRRADAGDTLPSEPDFIFRGGCTLLVDPETARVRYCIYKDIQSSGRLERTRDYLAGHADPSLRATVFGDPRQTYYRQLVRNEADLEGGQMEPFALLHRSFDDKEVL